MTSSITVNLYILSKWQCSDELLIFPSGPRGGHLVLVGQLRRIKYFSTRIRYHTNGICTFNPSAFKIICSGDVETNPGDETANISSSNAGSSPKNLRCLLLNARSLRNKVLDLQALLLEDYFPVIAITETWLDSSFMDFELGLNDYCVHRKDRQDRRGGGVLLAVHTDLISIRRRDLEYNDNIETVMVEICQKSKDNVLFGVCYRPPSADVEYSLKLRQCLERIEMTRFATCFLVGDFNFPSIDWHSLTATSSDSCTVDFCDMLNDHFLVQCNFNPTRMLNETDGNILDLILTKTPDLVSDVEVLTDHFNSDHFPVSFNIKLLSGHPRKSVSRKNYNFKKADFNALNELLKYIPWNCAFLEEDVDICTERVNDLLLAAADMCIPTFTVKKKTNPPWITKEILNKITKKKDYGEN